MLDYGKLIDFLDLYIEHYSELLDFEDKKVILIMNDNISGLTKSLSKEQALVMQTNSLEKKRIELTEGKTFKELIAECDTVFVEKLKKREHRLTDIINQIKKLNEYSLNIAKKRVTYINNLEESVDVYNKNGQKRQQINDNATLNKDA